MDPPRDTATTEKSEDVQLRQGSVASGLGLHHATWQWYQEKEQIYLNFSGVVSRKIERAYQAGEPKVRLKQGKSKVIKEIFFCDMMLYEPTTGTKTTIRREGPKTCRNSCGRRINEWLSAVRSGRPYRMSFDQCKKHRGTELRLLEKKTFDISRLYWPKEQSLFATIALHPLFTLVAMITVAVNCLWLGYEANENSAGNIWGAEPRFLVAENIFCIVFVLEILIRFLAYQRKRYCLQDLWFLFDALLVFLMVSDIWIVEPILYASGISAQDRAGNFSLLRMMRVLKLARISRFARLLRFCPEAMAIFRGLCRALRSVGYTLLLMIMLIYGFGIFFKSIAEAHPSLQDDFATVGDSMWFLLLHGIFCDDIADKVSVLREASAALTVYFMAFTVLSAMVLLNMLVGIIFEVVANETRSEKERSEAHAFRDGLLPILKDYDNDGDGYFHKTEFSQIMEDPEAQWILGELGVDPEDIGVLQDSLFQHDELDGETEEAASISYTDFMECALRLKGNKSASVQHVAELRQAVMSHLDTFQTQIMVQLQAIRLSSLNEFPKPPPEPPVGTTQRNQANSRAGTSSLTLENGPIPVGSRVCMKPVENGPISVGSRVRMKPGVVPKFGWQDVTYESIGMVKTLPSPGCCLVQFPKQNCAWNGLVDELEEVKKASPVLRMSCTSPPAGLIGAAMAGSALPEKAVSVPMVFE